MSDQPTAGQRSGSAPVRLPGLVTLLGLGLPILLTLITVGLQLEYPRTLALVAAGYFAAGIAAGRAAPGIPRRAFIALAGPVAALYALFALNAGSVALLGVPAAAAIGSAGGLVLGRRRRQAGAPPPAA
ncbi:MAG TPA: hypothetical protein VFU00_09710 [Gemmatimonadales bacterium]|nr:hypothetical protein [Gemmatimonadales bacterium]